jgi:hypothetical protein
MPRFVNYNYLLNTFSYVTFLDEGLSVLPGLQQLFDPQQVGLGINPRTR